MKQGDIAFRKSNGDAVRIIKFNRSNPIDRKWTVRRGDQTFDLPLSEVVAEFNQTGGYQDPATNYIADRAVAEAQVNKDPAAELQNDITKHINSILSIVKGKPSAMTDSERDELSNIIRRHLQGMELDSMASN